MSYYLVFSHVVIDDLRSFATPPDRGVIYLRNYKEAETWVMKQCHDVEKSEYFAGIIIKHLYMDFDLGDFSVPDKLMYIMDYHGFKIEHCHIVTSNPSGQLRLRQEAEKMDCVIHIDPGGRAVGLIGGY